MIAGLLRLVAPSGVYLLATTTTTAVFVMSKKHADGAGSAQSKDSAVAASASSAAAVSATDPCDAEQLACNADSTCSDCSDVWTSKALDECMESDLGDAFNASSSMSNSCSLTRSSICCTDELSKHDCIGNDLFVEFGACTMLDLGCSVDDVTPISCVSKGYVDTWLRAIRGGAGVRTIGGSPTAAVTVVLAFGLVAAVVSVGVMVSVKRMPDPRSVSKVI